MIPLFEHTSYAVERRRARRRDFTRFLLWLAAGAAASFLFVHVADKALGQAAYDAANHQISPRISPTSHRAGFSRGGRMSEASMCRPAPFFLKGEV